MTAARGEAEIPRLCPGCRDQAWNPRIRERGGREGRGDRESMVTGSQEKVSPQGRSGRVSDTAGHLRSRVHWQPGDTRASSRAPTLLRPLTVAPAPLPAFSGSPRSPAVCTRGTSHLADGRGASTHCFLPREPCSKPPAPARHRQALWLPLCTDPEVRAPGSGAQLPWGHGRGKGLKQISYVKAEAGTGATRQLQGLQIAQECSNATPGTQACTHRHA